MISYKKWNNINSFFLYFFIEWNKKNKQKKKWLLK